MTVHQDYKVHKSTLQETEMIVHQGFTEPLNPKIKIVVKISIKLMHL